ncbi:reverse transcriptase domain-containing protein [Tanacetum coccineum]
MRSSKSYDPPVNPNDQQNDSKIPINFDSDDEDDEPTPQPKTQTPKPVKETPLPKPYKPKIPYPQRLRKEKMEAQYGKFLDMIRAVRINVPFVDVLAGMPSYGKFLKELISNKHKIEQISVAFLSDESSAMIQNKVPPKLGDPKSFLIPCNFNKTFSCNALADVGSSINLMLYSLYAKLSLKTLKPTKMSVRLVDRSFQYPVGIAENMLVEVVKQKQLNLGVGTERMIFNIDSAIKHSNSNDDICFSIDEILEEDFDALLDEGSKILHSIEGTILEEEIFSEFDKFIAMAANENYDSEYDEEEPKFKKLTINTDYKIKTSLKEPLMDLELKPVPDNLEYVFLEEPSFLHVIISSQLSAQNKSKLVTVLKKHKEAFAWKTTDIPRICPSFYKCKIQLLDDKKPVVQKTEKVKSEHARSSTFQRCMLAIFHDMIEESVEVFMDDFSVFGNSFDKCLNNLDKKLQRTKMLILSLIGKNVTLWSKKELCLDTSFYRRFIKDFSKIARPLTKLLEKDTPFEFDDECQKAFELLNEKLTCAPMIKSKIKKEQKVAADHLSRIDNNETSDDNEVDGNFPGETLMEINTRDEPCYISKWAEAQALPTNDARVVIGYLSAMKKSDWLLIMVYFIFYKLLYKLKLL